jgi:hypothetical protein
MHSSIARWSLPAAGAVLLTAGAGTAAAAAPQPNGYEAQVRVLSKYCLLTDEGYRAGFSARATVKLLDEPAKAHYIHTNIRIDRLGLGQQWRKLEGRKNSTSLFSRRALPFWTTPGVRTAVSAVNAMGELRGIVTVQLKRPRTGPDKTVWTMDVERRIACDTGY